MSERFSVSEIFLNAKTPLTPRNAVAAIILDNKNRVLLQLRDNKEEIFFPNHWGCFGGAIEPDESPKESLIRELKEELDIDINPKLVEKFIDISFNTTTASEEKINRYYYVIRLESGFENKINLGEGQAFEFFDSRSLLTIANVSPYDRFGLWLYFNQNRLAA